MGAPPSGAAPAEAPDDGAEAAPLLSGDFVRQLEVLRRRLEIRARSGGMGNHRGPRRGGSAEFEEHRNYSPGDDLRRIDWAAYARSGNPVVKVFRSEEDAIVRVVCDSSASLGHGRPSKLLAAKQFAAAVGYMALVNGERAQLIGATDGRCTLAPAGRGRSAVTPFLRRLDGLEAGGETSLALALETLRGRARRAGMVVLISDFLDDGSYFGELSRLVAAGHDVSLVQVLAPDELAPTHEGDFNFVDSETGAVVELTVDAATINAYLKRLESLFERLSSWAKRHGARYIRIASDMSLEHAIKQWVSTTATSGRG